MDVYKKRKPRGGNRGFLSPGRFGWSEGLGDSPLGEGDTGVPLAPGGHQRPGVVAETDLLAPLRGFLPPAALRIVCTHAYCSCVELLPLYHRIG